MALQSLESKAQLSFATRVEDWTCLGQHKRHPEFPVVTRGGGGGEAGEASPPRGGNAGTRQLRWGPCPPGFRCARPAPARMPLPCPPARRVPGGAEVARPHLHRGYPDAANRSAAERPRKISKSTGRALTAPVLPRAREEPSGHLLCPTSLDRKQDG